MAGWDALEDALDALVDPRCHAHNAPQRHHTSGRIFQRDRCFGTDDGQQTCANEDSRGAVVEVAGGLRTIGERHPDQPLQPDKRLRLRDRGNLFPIRLDHLSQGGVGAGQVDDRRTSCGLERIGEAGEGCGWIAQVFQRPDPLQVPPEFRQHR